MNDFTKNGFTKNGFTKQLLADFLSELGHHQSVAGCNDYNVILTDESREFLYAAYEGDDDGYMEKQIQGMPNGATVCVSDFVLLHHLIKVLGLPRSTR